MLISSLVLMTACTRKEPAVTDTEAENMMTGVVITNQSQRIQLTANRLKRVRITPDTQKGSGTNCTVQLRFLTPDPSTGELKELGGMLRFVRNEYGCARISFQQMDIE
jgi:hypothetical protein